MSEQELGTMKFVEWPGRYTVDVAMAQACGYQDVSFRLFHDEMPEADVDALLRDCGWTELPQFPDDDAYARTYVVETFSAEEVEALKGYFNSEGESVKARPAHKPAPGARFIGVSALAVGGDTDLYMFSKDADYNLPFKVIGYVDFRDCEWTPERRKAHVIEYVRRVLKDEEVAEVARELLGTAG
jgi:hypothetical protein